MTAVELVESNLDVLKSNSEGIANLQSYQGDALDLGRFKDGEFDLTLVFGPMYHLYEQADVQKAIDEALRVTKKGGTILISSSLPTRALRHLQNIILRPARYVNCWDAQVTFCISVRPDRRLFLCFLN